VQGQLGGAESVAITVAQYPKHTHPVLCSAAASGGGNLPAGAVMGGGQSIYVDSSITLTNALDNNACKATNAGSNPHSNLQPYLTLNWIIAIEGVYPSQT
jgi:microcystin-dependent protein